jgi:Fe-S-cluster containining protein
MTEGESVATLLEEYQLFLKELDTWFRSVRVKYGDRMQCGKGCTLCCRGLFDVPLADAFRAAAGYQRLSASIKNDVLRRARLLHAGILEETPQLDEPFFLNRISEDRIDGLADRFGDVRCPFLAFEGDCLIYEFRPSACILEGVPMVDAHDGPFDDWCALNFTGGMEPELEKDLRLDYYEIEATIRRTSQSMQARIPLHPSKEATVFIPSIIVAFDNFWSNLLQGQT